MKNQVYFVEQLDKARKLLEEGYNNLFIAPEARNRRITDCELRMFFNEAHRIISDVRYDISGDGANAARKTRVRNQRRKANCQ